MSFKYKIKLPSQQCDDFIAWHPEESGVFTVRSAYRLGVQPALDAISKGQLSSSPTGDQSIWNLSVECGCSPEIPVFLLGRLRPLL
jgi:hypothetical protein